MERYIKVKSLAYYFIDLPLVHKLYKKIYVTRMKKKLQNCPDSLVIEPFNCCNLKCVMCPYQIMTRAKINMPMDLFKKAVDQAHEMGLKNIDFTCYNEIFMDNDLFERIAYVKGKKLNLTLFSNGTLMSEEKIQKLLENPPDKIIFSFDGFSKETYENIRIGADFESTKDNILGLIQKKQDTGLTKPLIQVNFVLMNKNIREAEYFKFFWENKADCAVYGFIDHRFTNKYDFNFKTQSNYPYPCGRAFNNWGVLSNGNVTFCACQDYDGKYIVGNINQNSLKEIYYSSKFENIREMHMACKGDKIGLCKNCNFLYRPSLN